MELCLEIGGCTLAELKARMRVEELRDWRLFARTNLLPARRLEMTVAVMTQAYRGGRVSEYMVQPPPFETAVQPVVGRPSRRLSRREVATTAGQELSGLSGGSVKVIDMTTGRAV